MQQVISKLKMAKCSWNVIKLDSNHNVWGWENTRFLLLSQTGYKTQQIKNWIWLIVKVYLGNCAWNNEYLINRSQQCWLASMNRSIVSKWATFTFHSSMQKSTNLAQSRGDILKYVDIRCTINDYLLFQKRLLKLLALGCLHRHLWKSSSTMPRRNIPNKFTNLPSFLSFWSDLPSMHTSFTNNNVWP